MIHDSVRQDEEQRLQFVLEKIRGLIDRSKVLADERQSTVGETRKDFWDDVTVNLSYWDEIMETYASITQQAMTLAAQERSLWQAEDARYRLLRMLHSPYFGRIDFKEDGDSHTEKIYIGIASLLDEETQTYWIYDWRAPISNLFYDYPPGPANYETPIGTIVGKIELKRQYMIRGSELKAVFDTGLTIGDEVLQQILGQHADDHMKSIVATIQKEQNQIIRDESHRVLIVQGAAGSGKTSVALQRVAYLLYKHRQTLNADNMVLFSPNAMFNSYVSTVLPELGEANMQQTTYQDYVKLRLDGPFRVEDPFDLLEYTLTSGNNPDYEARIAGIRFKSSQAFIHVIDTYAKQLEQKGMMFCDLIFRDKTLISKQQIEDYFYSLDSSLRLSNRINLLKEWLLGQLKRLAKAELHQPWLKDEIEFLDKEDYARAYQTIRQRNENLDAHFHYAEQEELLLSKYVINEQFKPLREEIKQLRFVSITELYKQLFSEESWNSLVSQGLGLTSPSLWNLVRQQTLEKLEHGEMAYEDATPYLYLTGLVQGFHTYNAVRHVILDEAQDYSAFQFAFLKRLFPGTKMTMLGDFNQTIYVHTTTDLGSDAPSGYSAVYDLYGQDQVQMIRLVRSYRSTKEIVDFTKDILPEKEPVEPFNRSGEAPKIVSVPNESVLVTSIVEEANILQNEGMASIAIICKTAQETSEAYHQLSDMMALQWVSKDTQVFQKGVVVIPAYLAKGLEFDAVIVFNGSEEQYCRENERKLFYTACTRAMHRLIIFHCGRPSPFLLKNS